MIGRPTFARVSVAGYPTASFEVVDFASGHDVPFVTIVAGTGGTAYAGIEACWRLVDRLAASDLRGRVRLIPTMDMAGFLDRSAHFCPLDDRSLAAAFAGGSADASVERTATTFLASTVIAALGSPGLHIDVRGGEIHERHASWVMALPGVGSAEETANQAAERCGVDLWLKPDRGEPVPVDLGSAGAMSRAGVPSLILSAGGNDRDRDLVADRLTESILRILAGLSWLESKGSAVAAPQSAGSRSWTHVARQSGLWVPTVAAGARVDANQPVGQVWDFFGNVLEEVHAPFGGWVSAITTSMAVDATPRSDGDPWFARTLTVVS